MILFKLFLLLNYFLYIVNITIIINNDNKLNIFKYIKKIKLLFKLKNIEFLGKLEICNYFLTFENKLSKSIPKNSSKRTVKI